MASGCTRRSQRLGGVLVAALCSLLGTSAAAHERPVALPPVRLPTVFEKESIFRQGEAFPPANQVTSAQNAGLTAASADKLPRGADGVLASRPDQVTPIYLDEEMPLEVKKKPSEGKDGFVQDVTLMATWLPQPDEDDLGFTDVSLSATVGLPFPTRRFPLLITSSFEVKYLDGQDTPDLPPRLYSTFMQFRWLPKLSDYWRLDIGVAPGVYSDFEIDDDDAFRLTGRGLGILTWSESLLIAFGVLYLDRPDVKLLPVGGIIWTPSDDWKFEVIFPRPKFAHRIYYDEVYCEEYWNYLSAEFGGDSWSIERADLTQDRVVLRDYRVMLGLERKITGGIGTFIEAGYVFGRIVEYQSATPDYEPDDTFLLRAGARY